ncbi:NAD(P)-binding protein [Hygrophoropsis aurantiaca]|uniref:NAD(P)-binding protein n=1 Tax=Hygrophoropsis aurantiaca TaxID=72124 RepID=A0ACB8AKJ6_9AGAM|nr:NAD(P)-binding protein [Hygrophoropsis aurantiaca]
MGLILSVIDQNFPPKATWGVNDIPDLSGKVVIVTGGNSGLGKETARALLSHNAKVYLGCRDAGRAQEAIDDLKKDTGKDAHFLQLDLADLHSVKSAVVEFQRQEPALHILINNGGVMACPVSVLTKDGYDMQFGTNVLGHFFLTKLLLPQLETGAGTSSDGKARVVNVSSQVHVLAPGINFDTLRDGPVRRKMSPGDLYNQSKFGNVVLSHELARRYGNLGIASTALHPGSIKTSLGRHIPAFVRTFIHALSHSIPDGALTQLWGATALETTDSNGKYLIPWGRFGEPDPKTKDPAIGQKLWDWMESQVNDM